MPTGYNTEFIEVLPNPEIIIAAIEKILRAFENACPVPNGTGVIQTELIRVRRDEIKRLQAPAIS